MPGPVRERRWAIARAIGSGAEDGDDIADLGARQARLVGEPVERGTQAADDIHLFLRLRGNRVAMATG